MSDLERKMWRGACVCLGAFGTVLLAGSLAQGLFNAATWALDFLIIAGLGLYFTRKPK